MSTSITSLGGRKFLVCAVALIFSFAALILGLVSGAEFLGLVGLIVAAYSAGNAASKWAKRKEE